MKMRKVFLTILCLWVMGAAAAGVKPGSEKTLVDSCGFFPQLSPDGQWLLYSPTEATSLMLRAMVHGSLDKQSDIEKYVTSELNKTNIGPLGLGGKTTVLGSFVNIGPQRASGVRIVAVRPSCFVEPRVASFKI